MTSQPNITTLPVFNSNITLRPYQQECIDVIRKQKPGAYLIYMATGLGKTVVMSHIPFQKRMLILSHREELVYQPAKYFNCSFGVEKADTHSNGTEWVVSASVQSLTRRLDRFQPDDFDVIVTDEAHHAVAKSYRKIYEHFLPGCRLHLGFTATPNRADNVGLENIFEDIIFERNLIWGIKNGYLCQLECLRADIGINLDGVDVEYGDFNAEQLEKRINLENINQSIVTAIRQKAKPPVIVFCVSVDHARRLAEMIPGAVSVAGGEPREDIVKDFKAGKIPVLTNCMVFSEGTDLPNIRTVVIAPPTKSENFYAQMVGRATRRIPGKDKAILIDCVGGNEDTFCTAPSLIGLSLDTLDKEVLPKVQGDLLELPQKIRTVGSTVQSFLRSIKVMDILARKMKLRTHGMRVCAMPDGSMVIPVTPYPIFIPKPDELGRVVGENGAKRSLQSHIDRIYKWLSEVRSDASSLWKKTSAASWINDPISEKQQERLESFGIAPDFAATLSKGDAALAISGLKLYEGSLVLKFPIE